MNVSIVGTGYVGLVTGACLAEMGHRVICVDVDPARVAALNAAKCPIHEAGLPDLIRKHASRGLTATTDIAAAVLATDLTLIAVGTPFDGQAIDLSYVTGAASQIGEALRTKRAYHVVAVKSTVVPGTTDGIVLPALERASGKQAGRDFGVGMNPEFLSEGEAVRDFLYPDRIVIGSVDERAGDALELLYAGYPAQVPRLRTNTRTAEMIKYASNALLASLISFSNELANLGAAIGGIDTVDVMRGVRLSQYFQARNEDGAPPITSFLAAGCGFGGSCLPKDVSALAAQGKSIGMAMPLLDSVLRINRDQPGRMVELLRKHWADLHGVRVAILGLAFKPGTNDMRESPALGIIRELLEAGAILKAHDPVAIPEAAKVLPTDRIALCESLEVALDGVDAVVLVTPWSDYRALPELLRGRDVVVVDARRSLPKASFAKYEGTGL
jgi:UDPglucose 6-dehydrogenase/GDP-mannose 6-dehydrogenase